MGKNEMIKIEYSLNNRIYELNCLETDARTQIIKNMKEHQKNKINSLYKMSKIFDPEIVIDIGCNYGEFLLPFTNDEREVLAYEPNKEIYECAKTTFEKYKNIKLFNNSVLDSYKKQVDLFIPSTSGNASLDKKFVATKIKKIQSTEQLDIKKILNNYENFLIKIDIEGMENKILNEIHKEENKFNSFCILFELNRFGNVNKSFKEIEDFLDGKIICPIFGKEKSFSEMNFYKFDKTKISNNMLHKILTCDDLFVFKGDWGDRIINEFTK